MPKNPKSTQGRDAFTTQQKILAAAEAEFAEKGFDGGRVDEIARRAGVNKAMLYYYFQSKEQLLKALTKKHFLEIAEEKKRFIQALSCDEPGAAKRIGEHSLQLFNKRKSFLRILAIEAFKNNEFAQELFRIMEAAVPHLNTATEPIDIDPDKRMQLKTNLFFFSFTPLLMYLTLGKSWTEYTDLEEQRFQQTFLDTFHNQTLNSLRKSFPINESEDGCQSKKS